MLEGALCFPEPAWPSLVAPAAAAGTCGEVGGELGDLLSDALGLADRFSGCAPSLSCKNQNSTVSPAVTTLEIWVRERPPEEGREGGGCPSPGPPPRRLEHRPNSTESPCTAMDGKPGGGQLTRCMPTARISSSLAKRGSSASKQTNKQKKKQKIRMCSGANH